MSCNFAKTTLPGAGRQLLKQIQVRFFGPIRYGYAECRAYSLRHSTAADPAVKCSNPIYCDGNLLKTVQLARIFPDSKTFVDFPLKYDPDVVLRNFSTMMHTHADNPSLKDILAFVDDNFEQNGGELEPWTPDDFHPNPKFLTKIRDGKLKDWASSIHYLWSELGRKISLDVKARPNRYSLIYVPNPVIVPGGRFKEFYYWDSYWIQEGLLLSEMANTVKGMIKNFVEMVRLKGFVPNGGRIYYDRSQPPLLIPMVKNYLDATNDMAFLEEIIDVLDTEFHFWINHRTVMVTHGGQDYRMGRYCSIVNIPRPESYFEDFHLAATLEHENDKHELYSNLRTAAESGWDFSTRWYTTQDPNQEGDLIHVKTTQIVPVDLNAFLYYNAKLMHGFYKQMGKTNRATVYRNYSEEFKAAINEVLWDDELGCWFDYDLIREELRTKFYASNIIPLWAGVQESQLVTEKVVKYLKDSTALSFFSGIPTSLVRSGQQWDFPNGWAPLQSFVVQALERSQSEEGKVVAFDLADKWLRSNYETYLQTNAMFEKYDVTSIDREGTGGEYVTQIGFGWTNGVVLDFLNRYGDRLNSSKWTAKEIELVH